MRSRALRDILFPVTIHIGSESVLPVESVSTSGSDGGVAIPVYLYTSATLPADRKTQGARPMRVKFLAASDLIQNGGKYKLVGRATALPVIAVTTNGEKGGKPISVYDVTNLTYP